MNTTLVGGRLAGFGGALHAAVLCSLLVLSDAEAQRADEREISVDDPRPVAEALETLSARHGGVIVTYEDPPYEYAGDIKDVTLQVRKDLDRYAPGKAPKVLIPKGGALLATYGVSPDTGDPVDWAVVFQAVVDAQLSTESGGRFRVERDAKAFHVIPTYIRDASGKWVPVENVLDALISIQKEGNGFELLSAITEAVTKETGQLVGLATAPTNFLLQYRGALNTPRIRARDVLTQFLDATGAQWSWRLLYGPDEKREYALNLRVEAPPPAPKSSLQIPPPPRPGDPTPAFRLPPRGN